MKMRISKIKSLSKSQLQNLVGLSKSRRECFERLGLKASGRTLLIFYERVEKDNIDISHFGRRAKRFNKIELKDILVENSTYQSNDLRKRLIAEGIVANKCVECGQLPWWNGKPLTLSLDHKNGIRTDNRLDNLRLLCPNCHTQTNTFGGKNVTRYGRLV